MQPPTRLLLWGPPALQSAQGTVPFAPERRYQLLALLALHDGQWLGRDRAAALLWPGHEPAAARRNLRKVLCQARAVPGVQALQANEQALRWVVDTDLLAFERAVRALPGQPWARNVWQGAERRNWRARVDAGALDPALALRRGDLLQGLLEPADTALLDWLRAQHERCDQAWHTVAAACLRLGPAPEACLRIAQRMLELDACDETALAAALTACQALGRPEQALGLYRSHARRLHDELGLEPSDALRALLPGPVALRPQGLPNMAAVAAGAQVAPGLALQVPSPGAFVGRKAELAELSALVRQPECRLLTLQGPGGAGKSRLARQACVHLQSHLGDGVLWVELEDLADVAEVPARLAQNLGLMGLTGDDAGQALEQLCAALPPGPALWVLDNAEHLAQLGPLLARLLAAAPALKLLVTSRRRLHVAGEWVLPLAGLVVPDDESHDLQAAASFDAVRLFEARAQSAQPGFSLARHLDAVLDIVDAVAGMPLAIELAAAWVRLLPPQRIAADLRQSIDLLERDPASTTPLARPQHASLRGVLERSWALLAPRERDALAALTVFSGGFTHEAARAVAHCPLPLLSALVDKSVVAVAEGGRFGLHPAVAAFASEQLALDPVQAQALRLRHAGHFSTVLAALAPHATGDPRPLVAGVQAELANLCVAWRSAVQAGRVDWVADMVRALWAFFENRGRQREGVTLLAPALALPADSAPGRLAQARLRHGLSMLHHRVGQAEEALQLARSGTELAAHGPDTEAWIGCVLNTGSCHWLGGDVPAAIERFEHGLAIARARADRQCVAWALGNLGVALDAAGRPAEAEDCLLQALAGSSEVGDLYGVGVHLLNLGSLARDRADRPDAHAARRWFERASAHTQSAGIDVLRLYAAVHLGRCAREAGDWAAAQAHCQRALDMSRKHGQLVLAEAAELGLARLALQHGDAAQALQTAQRLAHAARQRGSDSDLAHALLLQADGLAHGGQTGHAAQVLRSVLALPSLHAPTRGAAQAALAALAAQQAQPLQP
jgi:predicted ATPase/DNA-binding SARP family transcriptional activator